MQRLGSLDAVFLSIEGPTSPMGAASVGIFDGPVPPAEEVRSFVGAKLALVPRCRQRVRSVAWNALRPVWVDASGFDLDQHVRAATLPAGGEEALEHFVEDLMAEPLDRRRPLWEMWIVDGLDGGRWAVVTKVHHCMVDGIAGTDLLCVMMDADPAAMHPVPSTWAPEPELAAAELARHTLRAGARSMWTRLLGVIHACRRPRATAARLRDVFAGARALWLQPSHRGSPLTGPIGRRRRWAHASVTLDDVATVRRALGGTVNDVVLTAVTRGLRDLLVGRGVPVESRTVMALVPVSMRTPRERGLLDNRVAVTHALLPVGIEDPVDTLFAVRRHLDEVKASHETEASTLLLHVGEITPHPIAQAVARAVVRIQQNIETVATNVPGPQHPLYLCGRRMLAAYPFAPIAGRIRIAVALWSYDGTLYLGLTADRDGVNDLGTLVNGIERGFTDLLAAAVKDEPRTAPR